ncbi:hypothetical protein BDF21DRAFT_428308, partial [Thamnidium elegans]
MLYNRWFIDYYIFYFMCDFTTKCTHNQLYMSNIVIQSVMMDQTEDGSQFIRVETNHSKVDRIGY